ncbi:MAG TPA: YraN family protein [Blastocatellia bacterium]|nr:YraN family protein [Blastocatellia bacterium]
MRASVKRLTSRPKRAVRAPHLDLGERGEREALQFLKRQYGYRIAVTNFRVALGRGLGGKKITGEIDIIAYDGETLVFVEVKTRTSDEVAAPQSAVGLRKQRQIVRAGRRYREMMRIVDEPYRYDVVTLVRKGVDFNIELLKGYFDDGIFQRARFFV